MKLRLTMVFLGLMAMPLAASDLSRLQAILLDAQNDKVTIRSDAWRVSGNEAVTLANRIKGGRALARRAGAPVRQSAREIVIELHAR